MDPQVLCITIKYTSQGLVCRIRSKTMADSGDKFNWFGEGFDGFPNALPEDCVEYCIYVIDETLKDFDVREKLRNVQLAANTMAKDIFKGFIWQRESFLLHLEKDSSRSFLRGRTNFGDSTDDEWNIVYILHELSKRFPDAWIRVFDTDGEFLLIEAANALPIWLNPEIGDHRVWIHSGQLLVIPLESPGGRRKAQDTHDQLSLSAAISWIADPSKTLQRSLKIETEAFTRLEKYPGQILNSLHNTVITIPRNLAYVLHESPTSVSAAIEAFYLRDPIALKHVRGKTSNALTFPPVDLVKASIKFTKVGFAQLRSQQFEPPDSWKKSLGDEAASAVRPLLDIGMKLTCGFEMLLADAQNGDKKVVREVNILLDDIKSREISLPSDDNIESWGMQNDDDKWLDINFEDFERELSGKGQAAPKKPGRTGFGDQSAHANLQRTVKRFEDLLAQEADSGSMDLLDDMDYDDDSVSDASTDAPDQPHNESDDFAEDDFTAMMREMLDMPPEVMKEMMQKMPVNGDVTELVSRTPLEDLRENHETEPEEESVTEAMNQVEKELREVGALDP